MTTGPQFVVVVGGRPDWPQAVLGPFADRDEAERFAKFATREIDPAQVMTLCPPVAELLNWRDNVLKDWEEAPDG